MATNRRYSRKKSARTKSERLQSGSVEQEETAGCEELLMGEIHHIVWFIDSSKLHTCGPLQSEQMWDLRKENQEFVIVGRTSPASSFANQRCHYLTNVLCNVFIPEDDE